MLNSNWFEHEEGIVGLAAPNPTGFRNGCIQLFKQWFQKLSLSQLSSTFLGRSSYCGKLVTTIPGLFSTSFVSTAEREHLLSSGSSKNSKTDLHQSALNHLSTPESITVTSGIQLSDCPGFLLKGRWTKNGEDVVPKVNLSPGKNLSFRISVFVYFG